LTAVSPRSRAAGSAAGAPSRSRSRYGQREVDWMEEVIFEVKRSHGVKLTKQDMVRLGIHLTLQNYQRAGTDSALGALIRRRGMQTEE
jgi:hypothetical protein